MVSTSSPSESSVAPTSLYATGFCAGCGATMNALGRVLRGMRTIGVDVEAP